MKTSVPITSTSGVRAGTFTASSIACKSLDLPPPAKAGVAQFLGLLIRHKTAADQAMGQQIGEPGGVIHIGLAPRHILDVRRDRQHQLNIAVAQDVHTGFQ
jgi:hypothetical protein